MKLKFMSIELLNGIAQTKLCVCVCAYANISYVRVRVGGRRVRYN